MSWKKVGTIILVAHLDFHGESQPRVTAYLGRGLMAINAKEDSTHGLLPPTLFS